MNNRPFRPLALLMGLMSMVIGLSNCSEQRVDANQYTSPDQFMMDNRPEEQVFVIDTGGQGGPIIGNQGTHLWGDSSIFMFPDGGAVSYPIIIKLVELYTPKDMILYEMPTVAQGNLLVTGGEIRVRAFKDEVELVLRPGRYYEAWFPTDSIDPEMGLFGGVETGDIVDWEPLVDTSMFPVNTIAGFFYGSLVFQMGWINCDYFYGVSPDSLTTVTFTSEDDNLDNVVKFLYFDDIHSLMQVYGTVSGSVPIGASVKTICFAMGESGAMYHYYEEFTVTPDHVVQVTMQEISETDLLTLLGGL
jgi:hypothetical protein